VDIEEGRVGEFGFVGSYAEAPPRRGALLFICSRTLPGILAPGLINTHAPHPRSMNRDGAGMGGDLPAGLLCWQG